MPGESYQPVAQVREEIRALFDQVKQDVLYREGRQTVELRGHSAGVTNSLLAILSYSADGAGHKRRNADPLEFSSASRQCFCDWKEAASARAFRISDWSYVGIAADKGKALQFSSRCHADPFREHFVDLFELCFALDERTLTVMNLPGTGASVPQHFHTQIMPLEHRLEDRPAPNSIARLLNNLRPGSERLALPGGLYLTEIAAPIWGCRIEFDERYCPRAIGAVLYEAIHRACRQRSQLHLSYNIYVPSRTPRQLVVLFRQTQNERPFAAASVFDLLQRKVGAERANAICASGNRHWRWGWLECIGGLPARDDSFADTQTFDAEFWSDVYQVLCVPPQYRCNIQRQLRAALAASAERELR